ncbi:hypothetical protein JXA02_02175, partial [candidate division KSB1 bacterium]
MKKVLLVFSLLLLAATVYGACPDWTVNAADYQYNMSLTGVLVVDGQEIADGNAVVAAFVGDQVRG